MWYPNGYANQPTIAQEGATVGGWFTLRIVVQPQSGYILNATVTSAALAEQTSAHAVTPSNPQFQVSSTRYPGDPHSNVIILESLQNLADKHNGQYRVEFSVSYTVSTGSPPPNDRRTFTESGSFTFNALNLVLVDSRSGPYVVWKPDQMSGIGFSAQLVHAQNGTCTVRLELFDSSDNQNPVLVREFANVPRPGTWSWTWDGKLDDGSTAPRGIYLYRLPAYVSGSTPPDRDSNCSDFLFVRCSDQLVQMLGLSGNTVRYRVSYHLTSAENIPAYQPDSEIVVFGADLEICHSASLQGTDVTPGAHTIEVLVPWPPYDAVIFLVCPKDNHVHLDKAHRRRWALPHDQQRLPLNASVFNHEDYENTYYRDSAPKVFTRSLVSWGYKGIWWLERDLIGRIRYYGDGDYWPSIKRMRGALEYTWKGIKTLRVAMFAGHGSDDGCVLKMTDRDGGRLLVPSKQYYDDPSHKWAGTPVKEYACLILDTIAPTGANGLSLPNALAKLDLVVLVGCSQAKGGLAEQFARMGAGAAVGVGKDAQAHASETVFMEEFVRFVGNGTPIESAVNDALVSARAIIKRLVEDYGRVDYGDKPYVAAVVRGERANAPLNYPYQQP